MGVPPRAPGDGVGERLRREHSAALVIAVAGVFAGALLGALAWGVWLAPLDAQALAVHLVTLTLASALGGVVAAVASRRRLRRLHGELVEPLARLGDGLPPAANGTPDATDGTDTDLRELRTLQHGVCALFAQLHQRDQALADLRDRLDAALDRRSARLRQAEHDADRARRAERDALAHLTEIMDAPLRALLDTSARLLRSALSPGQRAWADEVQGASCQLLVAVDALSARTHGERSACDTQAVDFNLADLVGEAVSLQAPQARARGVTLSLAFTPPDTGVTLHGDATRLSHAIGHLVDEAILGASQGEVAVRVNVRERGSIGYGSRREAQVRIRVEGGGVGGALSAAVDGDGDSAGEDEGGLGLRLSRRLLHEMGGGVDVHSRAGAGATFVLDLRLPLARQSALRTVPDAISTPVQAAAPARRLPLRTPATLANAPADSTGAREAAELVGAIDHSVLDNLRELDEDGGLGLAHELFRSFLHSAQEAHALLESAAARGDAKALGQAAHVLKSSAANVGAQRLSLCYRALEQCGRERRLEDLQPLVERARRELDSAFGALNELLAEPV